ncbi:hypothetical protein CEQ31_026695 [Serratia odorifera]|nr:hypothetical protein CEQ31_026695 [Serratia odorifera]
MYVKKQATSYKNLPGQALHAGKTTGKEMVAHLAEVAEDVTNIILKTHALTQRLRFYLRKLTTPTISSARQPPESKEHAGRGEPGD